MRILHVIPQFPYFGGRTIVGGHASCLLSLALAQHQAGEQVAILSYIQGRQGACQIENGPIAHSLFGYAETRTVRFGLRFCQAVLKWIDSRRGVFDVIHVHSGYADYFMISSKLKAKSGLPTLHTLYCPIPENGGRWRLPGIHLLIRRWANQLDWRGGISENVARTMANYGMKNVERVRPALDIDRFVVDEEMSLFREKLGLGKDDLVILFVGNAKPQKNAKSVLRAVHKARSKFNELKLVITTELDHSSSDDDVAHLAREVRDLQLEAYVMRLGIVDDMPSLMKACDVLVAPFLDSLGPSDYFMAALEAMACGKPVIVSDVGGMRELITKDVGRLVDPHDSDSIAYEICNFLSSRQLRMQVGANARALVEKEFCSKNVMDSYIAIYRNISQ